MESSKMVYIDLEDLMFGIFSILLINQHKLEITYEELNEYENEVINYFQEKNYEIIVDNSKEKQQEFEQQHKDFKFENEKIKLLKSMFLSQRLFKLSDQRLKKALFNENAFNIFSEEKENSKKITLSIW